MRERSSALNRDDFFRAFPMKAETMRARTLHALTKLGFEPIDEAAESAPELLRAEIESYKTLIRRTGMRAEM